MQALAARRQVAGLIGHTKEPKRLYPLFSELANKGIVELPTGTVDGGNGTRRFDEVPIVLYGCYGGFGDVATTLKLAEGLKREFPDKEVVVYFHSEQEYGLVQRLYPHFDPEQRRNTLNGISACLMAMEDIRRFLATQQLAVIAPIPAVRERPELSDFLVPAAINLYIQEYDASRSILLPKEVRRDRICADRNGNLHMVLKSGFEEDSFGIHIDPLLVNRATGYDVGRRQQLLARLLNKPGQQQDPVMASEWGLAYYADKDSLFRYYLRYVLRALDDTKNPDRRITIFDFSSNPPARGYIEEEMTGYRIEIVPVGTQPHAVFLDMMGQAQLPSLITGNASLSEAISIGKLFLYDFASLNTSFADLVSRADEWLDWEDANRIRSLYGCQKIKAEDIARYPDIKRFYETYRAEIHGAIKETKERSQNNDYRNPASHIFGDSMEKEGKLARRAAEKVFEEANYAFAWAYRSILYGGDEMATLRMHFIFGSNSVVRNNEDLHRLFFDAEYQTAMYRLMEQIRERLDISKNLAELIRECVARL